ncbi:sugar ABC transporter ATPase, partial [Pseudomonas syringae pv. tagetis]
MNTQSIIVPQITTFPGHEARARLILRWLVKLDVVEPQLTTCGRTYNKMPYAVATAPIRMVKKPDALPFGQTDNGLEEV